MRFRTLTGVQRHRVTNLLFAAGVASAIATVTGSSLLGCPAVSRDSRLDGEQIDDNDTSEQRRIRQPTPAALQGMEEQRFVGGKMEPVPSTSKDRAVGGSTN
ncbi:hypothetical protein H4S02_005443 [Coemansia sp. RSA 2611]|uniref:Uncharacterized protein n=1 Tax=Coemansia linderi TaxID=2663919 RepID=A0ACC1K1V4_9FUNG|nr:hypothetical protein H4S02_005443 [Coemansia sp. RSA 2611]KAJ2413738.1 hypothetical protein GGI10_002852 [Coemansia sp. RSA 2530]KAJ2701634.1 hypothetical protein H4218_001346 [Coemansia sp. IMI 209128]KAJ2771744.1 hypothetical protein GGI18_004987 [Coemansia linderi]